MSRHAFVAKVRPECLEKYVEAHRSVWPELQKRYRDAGIRNFSIFAAGNLLFLYLESDNYAAAEAALANDPVDAEWQKLTGPMMVPDSFTGLTEIYHQS